MTTHFCLLVSSLLIVIKGVQRPHMALLLSFVLFTIVLEILKNPKWETTDLLFLTLVLVWCFCCVTSFLEIGMGLCWIMPLASWRSLVLLKTAPAWINCTYQESLSLLLPKELQDHRLRSEHCRLSEADVCPRVTVQRTVVVRTSPFYVTALAEED